MSLSEYVPHSDVETDVGGIALHALVSLATRSRHAAREVSQADAQAQIVDAVRSSDLCALDQTLSALVAAGHSREDIANIYVPHVARTLGQGWVDDQVDFATVSIGCARLQGYLRRQGLDWSTSGSLSSRPVATALLIVPEFDQHTLGATLLAGQLRAQGVNVVTLLDASPSDIDWAASQRKYNSVMISSSRSETVALLASAVLRVRKACAGTPIMIGGNVLDQTDDVVARTGADLAARSWTSALDVMTSNSSRGWADVIGLER